jgi:hypothetical protein
MNAFKHGRTSRQYMALLSIISRDPEALLLLRELAEQGRNRRERLRRQAQKFVDELLSRIDEAQMDAEVRAYEDNQRIPPLSYLSGAPK